MVVWFHRQCNPAFRMARHVIHWPGILNPKGKPRASALDRITGPVQAEVANMNLTVLRRPGRAAVLEGQSEAENRP